MILTNPDDKFLYTQASYDEYAKWNSLMGCVPVTLNLGHTPVTKAWPFAARMAKELDLPLVIRTAPPGIAISRQDLWLDHIKKLREICLDFLQIVDTEVVTVLGNQEVHNWEGVAPSSQNIYLLRACSLHELFADMFGSPIQIWYRFGDQQAKHWSTYSGVRAKYPLEPHTVLSARCYEIPENNVADFLRVRSDPRYAAVDYKFAAILSNPCGNGYKTTWEAGDTEEFQQRAAADGKWVQEQINAHKLDYISLWLHPMRAPGCYKAFMNGMTEVKNNG